MEATTNQKKNEIADEMYSLRKALDGTKAASMCLVAAIDQEETPSAEYVDGLFFTLNRQAEQSYKKLALLLK